MCSSDADALAEGNKAPAFRPGNLGKKIPKVHTGVPYPCLRTVQCYEKPPGVFTPVDSVRSSSRGQHRGVRSSSGSGTRRMGRCGRRRLPGGLVCPDRPTDLSPMKKKPIKWYLATFWFGLVMGHAAPLPVFYPRIGLSVHVSPRRLIMLVNILTENRTRRIIWHPVFAGYRRYSSHVQSVRILPSGQ